MAYWPLHRPAQFAGTRFAALRLSLVFTANTSTEPRNFFERQKSTCSVYHVLCTLFGKFHKILNVLGKQIATAGLQIERRCLELFVFWGPV
jgi:hypothetical protein